MPVALKNSPINKRISVSHPLLKLYYCKILYCKNSVLLFEMCGNGNIIKAGKEKSLKGSERQV